MIRDCREFCFVARRKRNLTLQQIVEAAASLLQRRGYDALTIRNVAELLGVKSASLYWHFKTKDDLEERLADEMFADLIPAEPTDDWRMDLRNGSLRLRAHLLSKRDAGRILAGRLGAGPNRLRQMEAGLGPFLRAGLDARGAAFASHAVHVYVQGFVIFETSPLAAAERKGKSRRRVLDDTRRTLAKLSKSAFPNITALADALTIPDGEGRFLYGLDCLIAGIEQTAMKTRRSR
jgi:TetR/AcrR family tetracycline transcriptional repressor